MNGNSAVPLILGYPASSFGGWGIEGLNMLLHWPGEILTAMPDPVPPELREGDPRQPLLERRVAASKNFQARLATHKGAVTAAAPVFLPLGNEFEAYRVAGGVFLSGRPSVGFPYIDEPRIAARCKARLQQYTAIVAASEWNRQVLADLGCEARLIHQAVDTALFNPSIRKRRADGRFRVFSGGKCEWRKGQDIALRAFARFAARHDDAVLVAAWGSTWREPPMTFAGRTPLGAPPGAENGTPDFAAWAERAGIKRHQFEVVPPVPNCRIPDVLATVDCAIFPSRAEPGANQPAMECMACGIPTALSRGTGHDDLESPWNCDGEAADAFLEAVYDDRSLASRLPEKFTWPARIAALERLLAEFG